MVVHLLDGKFGLNSVDKSPRRAPADNDQEAKQWKGYVDTLKRTVDQMHDICLAKQNVLGCEEALMYLTSAVRDFQSLISSINVELEWKDSENRPNAVRWEVIGTTNRRKGLSAKQLNESVPIQVKDPNEACTQCRAKRRMNSDLSDDENGKKTNADVYERLYGKRSNVTRQSNSDQQIVEKPETEELRKPGCITGKLTMPRSAMDIPQTKSSMAKIAASRQLLWQRHKKILTEKLSAKRRQEQSLASLGNRRRSLPILAAKQAGNSKSATETNLESIHETHEDDKNEVGDVDNSSTKTHAGFKTRSDGYAFNLLDMSGDDEWKALTEEEESLAQEEESLKKEIEETESLSIDEELQRRVVLDFSDVNIESDWRSVVDEWAVDSGGEEEDELAREAAVETPKPTQNSCRFRQPGELVQIHQRLLSPLRKRNLDAEEIRKRQTKAEELRILLQEQKSTRLKVLHAKVEDVRQKRIELLEKKRIHLTNKMEKAAENRQRNLDDIIKRLKENARGLENSFINAMEVEQTRLTLQLKEQDREQRLINLAEERSKQVKEKASKEAALDERKRTAEQQKVEKMREQVAKKQERQNLIETQKTEAVESQKKKARLYEQKLESIKTNEIIEQKNLRNKIQQKTDKSSKRYETVVEQIRQKAIGLSRSNGFASLADCTVPPSDLQYSLAGNNCGKKCTKCNYIAISDLNLIAHLLSSEHLATRSMELSDVNFAYLKSELENFIRVTEDRVLSDNEELITTSLTLNKKLRTKVKQKLSTLNLAMDMNVQTSPLKHNFDKKSNELRHILQERQKFSEQQRKKLEHCLSDLRRCILEQKTENRISMAFFAQQSNLISSLFEFLVKISPTSFECTSKIFYRLMCKVSHFILELLTANAKVCCVNFFTDTIFNLLEWTSDQIESGTSASNLDERADLIVSVYCILLILVSDSAVFVRTNLVKFTSQLNDRLQAISVYLLNSNFISYYKNVVLNGADPVEFGFGQSVRPLNVLCNLIAVLNSDADSNKNADSHVLNLHLTAIQCLTTEIYAKIRFEPVVLSSDGATTSSGTLMSSSFVSTNSSNWHNSSNVEVECAVLLRLWNSMHSRLASNSPFKQKILDTMKEDGAIQFVYILIVAIHNNERSLNATDEKNQLTVQPLSLSQVLDATGRFATLTFKHQIICIIGWQKSLLVQICKLPFEHFQNPTLRSHLLTALITILIDNNEGLTLIRALLLELLNGKPEERRRFEHYLPESKWRSALQFFEANQM